MGDTLAIKGYTITTPGIRILEKWTWAYLNGDKNVPLVIERDTTSTQKVLYTNKNTGEAAYCYRLAYFWPAGNPGNFFTCRQQDGPFFGIFGYGSNQGDSSQPIYKEINVVNVNSLL